MIVDVHTHMFDRDRHFGPELPADLDRCGISLETWKMTREEHAAATADADYVVVFGLAAAKTGWHIPNDFVWEYVRTDPARLIYFASIDPGVDGYMDELVRCHEEKKCRGVKIGPVYQGVHPHDPRYLEIYAYCERHGLPMMVHMGTTFSSGVPLEYARPAHMDRVAIDFPDLRIVIAHLGHPWEGEAIAAIRKNANLYADISALYYRPWQFYNSMRLLVEYGAQNKVLFGSDFPATTDASSIAGIRAVNDLIEGTKLPPVPREVLEEIIHRDSLSLLNIPVPEA